MPAAPPRHPNRANLGSPQGSAHPRQQRAIFASVGFPRRWKYRFSTSAPGRRLGSREAIRLDSIEPSPSADGPSSTNGRPTADLHAVREYPATVSPQRPVSARSVFEIPRRARPPLKGPHVDAAAERRDVRAVPEAAEPEQVNIRRLRGRRLTAKRNGDRTATVLQLAAIRRLRGG